jgi:hypothetical protein
MAKKRIIKIMVGSTVYGFEDQLNQVVVLLRSMGYKVLNSHNGSVKTNSRHSNLENCLRAVEECDLFLGIIRPYYGTGNIGEKNITFEEIKHAISLNKPYWFAVHRDVVFARKLLNKVKLKSEDEIIIADNNFFDRRTIDIYEHVLKSTVPIEKREGNWVQEFYRLDELLTFIEAQFSDKDFVQSLLLSVS